MPIKPENKARYPKNWKEIRQQRLEIDNYKCEKCGLPNHAIGYRNELGKFVILSLTGKPSDYEGHATGYKVFMIVLTIAHLDHVPENCDMSNLRAWCQKCHLNYDHKHHLLNSAITRKNKFNAKELF
jgi:5-methylcytosine-specific restriction endonuclease McrA